MNDEVEFDDIGNASRFYTKTFRDGDSQAFLSHYANVLGDALNPSMSHYWQTSVFTERGRKIHVERKGLLAALSKMVSLASKNGVDIRPFLWLERYVKGNVDRDPAILVEARYSFQELYLREVGEAGEGWREWDEQSRAASRTMGEVDDLFERLIEFAPSLPTLWETAPEEQMHTFALRDAYELVEESRKTWMRVGDEFPSGFKDGLLELLLRVRGRLRRLSSGRYRGSNCSPPADVPRLASELLAQVTELAILFGTDIPDADCVSLNEGQAEAVPTDAAHGDWLTVTQAASATGVPKYSITRAVDNGEVSAIGRRRERRIDPASLTKWQLKRAEAPLRIESEASVRANLDRLGDD